MSFEDCLKDMGEQLPDQSYYVYSEKYRSFMYKERMSLYIEGLKKIIPDPDVSTYKKCMCTFRQISKKTNGSFHYKIRYVNATYYIDYFFFIGDNA
jgi:hypothetical protein